MCTISYKSTVCSNVKKYLTGEPPPWVRSGGTTRPFKKNKKRPSRIPSTKETPDKK